MQVDSIISRIKELEIQKETLSGIYSQFQDTDKDAAEALRTAMILMNELIKKLNEAEAKIDYWGEPTE